MSEKVARMTRVQLPGWLAGLYRNNVPAQQYYSLDELLVRWERDEVTLTQLCDWVETADLVMGVRVRGAAIPSERFHREDGSRVTRRVTTHVFAGEPGPTFRTDYLGKDTLIDILTAKNGREIGAQVTYSHPSREPAKGTMHFGGERFYSKEALVVSHAEVLRIEALFKLGKEAPFALRGLRLLEPSQAAPRTLMCWAFLASVAYLLVMGFVVLARDATQPLTLNELGDFLAGAAAPLALTWLVVGFKLQAQASLSAEKELAKSSARQEETLQWLRVQAETGVSRLALEREKRESELEPRLQLSFGSRQVRAGSKVVQDLRLVNSGAPVRQLRVAVKGLCLENQTEPQLARGALEKGAEWLIPLTAPQDAQPSEGELTVEYTRSNGEPGSLTIPLALRPANGSAPTDMPTFEFAGLSPL